MFSARRLVCSSVIVTVIIVFAHHWSEQDHEYEKQEDEKTDKRCLPLAETAPHVLDKRGFRPCHFIAVQQSSCERLKIIILDDLVYFHAVCSSTYPDLGVNHAIKNVHEHVHRHQEGTIENSQAHDHRIVQCSYGIDKI